MYWTSRYGPQSPLVMTSGSQDWRPVQTCSLLGPPPPPTGADILWLLKHVRSAQVGSMHPIGKLSCFSTPLTQSGGIGTMEIKKLKVAKNHLKSYRSVSGYFKQLSDFDPTW